MTVSEWANAFLDLLYPPLCLHCDTLIEVRAPVRAICTPCLATLSSPNQQDVESEILDTLEPCYIEALYPVFEFNEVCREIIHVLKYARMPNIGLQTGEFAREKLHDAIQSESDAIVIPVPLHPLRQREREYNQSELLADGLFGVSSNPVHTDILKRSRYTRTQTRLSAKQRQKNIRSAFEFTSQRPIEQTVILVDDVVTTGSTLNEAARILKYHGVPKVIGVSLAAVTDLEALYGWK